MNDPFQNSAIDLVVLTRDDSTLHPAVEQSIASQSNVRLIVHRVIGKRLPGDPNRWSAIVRARNLGKRRGTSPWLMFLDDDVVLAPDCVRLLLDGLRERPVFAALAADYLHESHGRMTCPHVAMGAVLFRRTALHEFEFRWSTGCCECLCCCRDLRRKKRGIGYLAEARARHISQGQPKEHSSSEGGNAPLGEAHSSDGGQGHRRVTILAAFDRRHCRKFQHQFVRSLRAAGNQEAVMAFGYGLYPSERRKIERLPGVELIPLESNGVAVPIRRLLDFQGPLARLRPDTIVAYWDAGDVIFQDRLSELWSLVCANLGRLLTVAEPAAHPENGAIADWTGTIMDPGARRYAFDLLSTRPFLNSGFAAASAGTLLRYLQAGHELLHSTALRGTGDWGDQMAMNLYCHGDPGRFLAVDDRWNYCLCIRNPKEVRLLPAGRFVRRDGRPISVVHGNAGTLNRFVRLAPNALARATHTANLLV